LRWFASKIMTHHQKSSKIHPKPSFYDHKPLKDIGRSTDRQMAVASKSACWASRIAASKAAMSLLAMASSCEVAAMCTFVAHE